jgi:iron(III) transport system substrate-binding protein
MMLTKRDLRTWRGFRGFTTCGLMVLAILLVVPSTGMAAGKPNTVAEIALYQGPDREKVLIEGAKKEGKIIFYTTNTWFNNVVTKEFEKKYPFIEVLGWRTRSKTLIKRVMEEYAGGRFIVDVTEGSYPALPILHREGILQECYSPEARYYGDELKVKGKTGVYYLAARERYTGLQFNTEAVSPAEAPKTYRDLLDPKWKGMMTIVASGTGIEWIGNCLVLMGREYIDKLSRQDLKVQNFSAAALGMLIVSGEVPLSPTGGFSNVIQAKRKGAPVEWLPLEPTLTTVGSSGMPVKAPHPHAALLFLDYLHSKEGQQVVMKGGLNSPREDMRSSERKFKKSYLATKYSLEDFEKKYDVWESLLKELFIKKR